MPNWAPSSIFAAGNEAYRSPRYCYDNSARPNAGAWVLQRTLTGACFFEDATGRRLVAAGHGMLFSHHESSRYGYPPEATEPYRLQFITFIPGALLPYCEHVREEFGPIVRMNINGEAAVLFDEVVARNHQRQFRDGLQLGEFLFRLLVAVRREQINAQQHEDPIVFGHHLLTGELGGKLGLKEIARRAGVSREHFCRQYALRYGTTPGTVLRALKLKRARAMLSSTAMSIEEVAASCGFSGADSLRCSYRAYFGENPSVARHPRPVTAARAKKPSRRGRGA